MERIKNTDRKGWDRVFLCCSHSFRTCKRLTKRSCRQFETVVHGFRRMQQTEEIIESVSFTKLWVERKERPLLVPEGIYFEYIDICWQSYSRFEAERTALLLKRSVETGREMSRRVRIRVTVNMASSNSNKPSSRLWHGKLLAPPHVGAVKRVSVSVRAFSQGCWRYRGSEPEILIFFDSPSFPRDYPATTTVIGQQTVTSFLLTCRRLAVYPARTVSVLPCDRTSEKE